MESIEEKKKYNKLYSSNLSVEKKEQYNSQRRKKYTTDKGYRLIVIERNNLCRKSENGKIRRAVADKKYRNLYPDRRNIHAAVERAMKSGLLVKPKICFFCKDNKRLEGHHYR